MPTNLLVVITIRHLIARHLIAVDIVAENPSPSEGNY